MTQTLDVYALYASPLAPLAPPLAVSRQSHGSFLADDTVHGSGWHGLWKVDFTSKRTLGLGLGPCRVQRSLGSRTGYVAIR